LMKQDSCRPGALPVLSQQCQSNEIVSLNYLVVFVIGFVK